MKIGIFFGSTTGTTADLAKRIAKRLGVADADIHDVAKTSPTALGDYDVMLLGSSTWGSGELQDDWYDFLDGAQVLDLSGHKAALFGCGDETMADTFCNALDEIHTRLAGTGVQFIGEFNVDGYNFEQSNSVHDGMGEGLLIDAMNHPDTEDARVDAWCEMLEKVM